MRTTVTLDDDVAAAVAEIRRERSVGLSAAINELARAGLVQRAQPAAAAPFAQRTARLGARVDVANVAEVLALLDDQDAR